MNTNSLSTSAISTNPNGVTSTTLAPSPTSTFIYPSASPDFLNLTTDATGTYYTYGIDDFDNLITFSTPSTSNSTSFTFGDGSNAFNTTSVDWVTPLTDSALSASRPVPNRDWYLDTYHRAVREGAWIRVNFTGTQIHLYGDSGPAYGAYSLQFTSGKTTSEPIVLSAYYPALAIGPPHHLYSRTNLTEGVHSLLITNLGQREGIIEGESLLLDWVGVKERVGAGSGTGLNATMPFNLAENKLLGLNKTGSWHFETKNLDENPTDIAFKNKTSANTIVLYTTTENGATISHGFKGSAIYVYGSKNATHGSYRATLSSSSGPPSTQLFNGSAPCDAPAALALPGCEYRGHVLKYSAANLDPNAKHTLTLENVHDGSTRTVFDLSLIRIFDTSETSSGSNSTSRSLGTRASLPLVFQSSPTVNPLMLLILAFSCVLFMRLSRL